MTDGVDKLSAASGLQRDTLLRIWDEVKANDAKLRGCSRHDFGDLGPPPRLGKRYECRNCGGWASADAVRWYNEGLRHGGC